MSQRLNSFFAGDSTLRVLARKADQLAALDALFRKAAPASLLGASRVIGFEQPILKIGADNSAVAAKLRQLTPQILSKVQENNAQITGILIKVQVRAPLPRPQPSIHTLSPEGERQITELASNLANSPLKTALLRLIRGQTGS